MFFGMWYRGLSLVVGMGISGFRNMTMGYSFDYPISGLGVARGGAHELSIRFDFSVRNKNLPPLNVRRFPCPRI